MGLLYLSTKFKLDKFTSNEDLSSDRNHWKHKNTDRQADTHTETESDTLPI